MKPNDPLEAKICDCGAPLVWLHTEIEDGDRTRRAIALFDASGLEGVSFQRDELGYRIPPDGLAQCSCDPETCPIAQARVPA